MWTFEIFHDRRRRRNARPGMSKSTRPNSYEAIDTKANFSNFCCCLHTAIVIKKKNVNPSVRPRTATVHFTVPFYPPRDCIDCIWLPASKITRYEDFLQSKWEIKAFPMVNGLLWLADLETWVFVIRDFKCVESCPVNTTRNVLYNTPYSESKLFFDDKSDGFSRSFTASRLSVQ